MIRNDSKWEFWYKQINQNRTEEKIKDFIDLQSGWRFGDGNPIRESIINEAIKLNRFALELGFVHTDAIPDVDGSIEFLLSKGNHQLEFHIEPDNTITYYKISNNIDVDEAEGISFNEAELKITELWNDLCAPSGLSELENISGTNQDSQVQPSIYQVTDQESLSSTGNALPLISWTLAAT